MAIDEQELEAAVSLLLQELEEEKSEDSHEIFQRLTALLNQMRAFGMPLPDDLVRLEQQLAGEFAADAAKANADEVKPPD
ncbi:MAG: hypothetical protein ACREEE_08685 [Dongiaceae bacterium]